MTRAQAVSAAKMIGRMSTHHTRNPTIILKAGAEMILDVSKINRWDLNSVVVSY